MRIKITYEVAGSKPKRNLELVIETSCDASRPRKVGCWAEGAEENEDEERGEAAANSYLQMKMKVACWAEGAEAGEAAARILGK